MTVVGYTIAADGDDHGRPIVELSALFDTLDEARTGLSNIPGSVIEDLNVRVYEVRTPA